MLFLCGKSPEDLFQAQKFYTSVYHYMGLLNRRDLSTKGHATLCVYDNS